MREETVELPNAGGMSVGAFVDWNLGRRPGLKTISETMMFALNQEYVERDSADLVKPGDEFAFIPPVSGGGEAPLPGRRGLDADDLRLLTVWEGDDVDWREVVILTRPRVRASRLRAIGAC